MNILEYFLWNCPQVNATRPHWWLLNNSTLVQVMAWCRQATSHYLTLPWPRSMSSYGIARPQWVNTLRLRQNRYHFAVDTFECIFLNDSVWITIKILLKFVPTGPINNIPALFHIMAWCRPGVNTWSEPMMVRLPMHICVTWPQWVKRLRQATWKFRVFSFFISKIYEIWLQLFKPYIFYVQTLERRPTERSTRDYQSL